MNNLFQILADCGTDLASCCSDYGLARILSVARRALDLIQFVIPIVLIVMLAVQLTKMVVLPSEKDNVKSLFNKILAAVMCFMIPLIIDLIFTILPEAGLVSKNFELTSCWEAAEQSYNSMKNAPNSTLTTDFRYLSKDDLEDTSKSKSKKKSSTKSSKKKKKKYPNKNKTNVSSAKGKQIVKTAKSYLGVPYCIGGTNPKKCMDCSGFVQLVFKQYGVTLPRSTSSYNPDSKMFTKVNYKKNGVKAGDIVLYYPRSAGSYGHVAIATGNGNQIIHEGGYGVGVSYRSTYLYRSIKAVLRVKGVN